MIPAATIPAFLIGGAVLCAVVRLSQRYGFKTVMNWAGMIFLVIPGFVYAGAVVLAMLHGVKAPSMMTRLAIGSVVIVGAWSISRKTGWGNFIGWTFSIAMALCGLVIAGFVLLLMFSAAHASGAGGH